MRLEEVAGCVISNKNKQILLVREKNQDYYKIPSGKIEKNEKPYEAATRETKEETVNEVLWKNAGELKNSIPSNQIIHDVLKYRKFI